MSAVNAMKPIVLEPQTNKNENSQRNSEMTAVQSQVRSSEVKDNEKPGPSGVEQIPKQIPKVSAMMKRNEEVVMTLSEDSEDNDYIDDHQPSDVEPEAMDTSPAVLQNAPAMPCVVTSETISVTNNPPTVCSKTGL